MEKENWVLKHQDEREHIFVLEAEGDWEITKVIAVPAEVFSQIKALGEKAMLDKVKEIVSEQRMLWSVKRPDDGTNGDIFDDLEDSLKALV